MNDLLQVPEDTTNPLFLHDVVDVTRQMLQDHVEEAYRKAMHAFKAKDANDLQIYADLLVQMLEDLDRILASSEQFLLGKWLQSAASIAKNSLEAQIYQFNARNQITTWGPTGQIVDYANKQWAGMVKDYCAPRWKLFFDELLQSIRNNRKFNDNKCKQKIFKQIEEPFTTDNKIYPIEAHGDTMAIAREIYEKYK